MRLILIEQVRRKSRQKRGGDLERVEISVAKIAASKLDDDVLALDEALREFEREHPKKAEQGECPCCRRRFPETG